MPPFNQDSPAASAAETLAVQALAFIAGDPDQLGRFLATTGIGPAGIRQAAREPAFLAGILDYVIADESLLVAFAGHAGVDPMTVVTAQRVLSAGRPGAEDN